MNSWCNKWWVDNHDRASTVFPISYLGIVVVLFYCVRLCLYVITARDFLNQQFHEWIGRHGTTEWPPRSCHLTPCDFSMWDILKNYVFAQKPHDLHQLRQIEQSFDENPSSRTSWLIVDQYTDFFLEFVVPSPNTSITF
ncbi:hypothetical protein ANN_12026 [Periplaneta americana]|uniref:Uncharacterized protein n=1 Tax=Periplaneta americana TaxID=6978 RepID=A0ABQ8T8H7_PERAM|nr:hypothetical protein ANN_12026 [Periplaneta americana]